MFELAQKISFIVNGNDKFEYEYYKSNDINYLADNPQRRCPDLTKSKNLLGYEPKISLDEGLTRIYNFYKSSI